MEPSSILGRDRGLGIGHRNKDPPPYKVRCSTHPKGPRQNGKNHTTPHPGAPVQNPGLCGTRA
ncbi:hypothetical protein PspLS_00367 [Pyricularia sp. CBS 133598]|nr:hypothetical protein PspLS_00367 [Pyricularia sp. CBS 133598]